jgi:hypothetical protein
LSLDVTTGSKRLASLNDVKVLGVNVVVLWKVVVLLRDEDTLTEEVLVDLLAVCLWDEPGESQYSVYMWRFNVVLIRHTCWRLIVVGEVPLSRS